MAVDDKDLDQKIDLGINPEDKASLSRESSGKILGIDYGSKNIGLALSDTGQSQAFVYDTLQMSEAFWLELNDIITEEKIDKIIVGLPLNMKGEYTKKTEEVIYFIETMESYVKIPVETEDERLSTVEGQKTGGVGDRDEEAARIILQRYLDRTNN